MEKHMVEPTWAIAFRFWWALTWRGILLSFIFGLVYLPVVYFILVPISLRMDLEADYAVSVAVNIGSLIGSNAVAVIILKKLLRKNFGDFKVILLHESRQERVAENPVPAESR